VLPCLALSAFVQKNHFTIPTLPSYSITPVTPTFTTSSYIFLIINTLLLILLLFIYFLYSYLCICEPIIYIFLFLIKICFYYSSTLYIFSIFILMYL
jgi:hypothetical protein